MATATKSKSTQSITETLVEFVASGGRKHRVDKEAHVIYGVKILGFESINRRRYQPTAVREAIPLYEGSQVYVNHPKGAANQTRDYQELLGTLRGVNFQESGGLFANLHYNPGNASATQLEYDAESETSTIGFSHNVNAKTSVKGGVTMVESILSVNSVDLVTRPATTRNLSESQGQWSPEMSLAEMTLESILAARPDLKSHVAEEIKSGADAKAQAEKLALLESESKGLKEENEKLKAKASADERAAKVNKAITEAKLPADVVSDLFREQCYLADDAGLAKLIEDRAGLVKRMSGAASRPQSRDQAQVTEQVGNIANTKEFASALRR